MLVIGDLNEDIEDSLAISCIVTLATFSDVNEALKNRFRAKKSHSTFGIKYELEECLIDVDLFKSETFRKLLGYINTNVANQKKGAGGTIK